MVVLLDLATVRSLMYFRTAHTWRRRASIGRKRIDAAQAHAAYSLDRSISEVDGHLLAIEAHYGVEEPVMASSMKSRSMRIRSLIPSVS